MWTSNVLSSFSRGILQCDDLKEMALHYGLKDPTIHHIDKKTASWTEDQNKIGLLEKWVSFFSAFIFFLYQNYSLIFEKTYRLFCMYMAQLPTYTDVARHAFYQTRFFLNPTYVRGRGWGCAEGALAPTPRNLGIQKREHKEKQTIYY